MPPRTISLSEMSHSLLLVVAHLACQPQASLGTVLDDSVVLDYPDSVRQAVSLTKLSKTTIRLWYDVPSTIFPGQEVLEHLVQLDEAYFGGRNGKALFLGNSRGPEVSSSGTTNQPRQGTRLLVPSVLHQTQYQTAYGWRWDLQGD